MKVIAFIGRKKSGKTTSVCRMIQLSKGKKVFAFKHINEPEFEIDREGTDTWKMFSSGASLVVGSSARKLAIIARMEDIVNPLLLAEFLERFFGKPDVLLIEGFHKKIGKDERVYKVVLARNLEDLSELLEMLAEPIVAIVVNGLPKSEAERVAGGKPVLDISELDELGTILDSLPDNF